jgi:hypothetical protein
VVAILTQDQVKAERLNTHIQQIDHLFQSELGSRPMGVAKTKQYAQTLLGSAISLAYFYCHGERPSLKDPNTYLLIGHGESITTGDFTGWIDDWLNQSGDIPWEHTRPLVFINACHSVEINPDTVSTYVDAFVSSGRAAGVIGTEVLVHQDLAMDMANEFFRRLLQKDEDGMLLSVDAALRDARLGFLAEGNLFGLAYSPFCWADLRYAT